jgi:hypothetical protein
MSTIDRGDGWPVAELSRVARLRVLAAGFPGAHLHEQVVEAPFEDVWRLVSDLEGSTPRYEPDVSSLRILHKDGERWRVRVRLPWWLGRAPMPLDVTMRDGWCWMIVRPQLYVIGIAAEPLGSATRLAHMEGFTLPGGRWRRRLARPLLAVSRWRHRVHVPRDVARLAALLE